MFESASQGFRRGSTAERDIIDLVGACRPLAQPSLLRQGSYAVSGLVISYFGRVTSKATSGYPILSRFKALGLLPLPATIALSNLVRSTDRSKFRSPHCIPNKVTVTLSHSGNQGKRFEIHNPWCPLTDSRNIWVCAWFFSRPDIFGSGFVTFKSIPMYQTCPRGM